LKIRLLILTQYFPPEVGAPQNRLFELATRLQKKGVEVTVLTAMPNYPKMEIHAAYRGKKYVCEEMSGLKVHRSWIYVSQGKGILKRLLNYFSFVFSSAWTGWTKAGAADIILCESPPLFLGYSALFLKRVKKARLVFNVSDLWPESAEKLGVVTNKTMLDLAYKLEAKLYRKSALVSGQTQGICKNINERFPFVRTFWLPNGVDLNYYDPEIISDQNWRKENGFDEMDFIFLYAGILGLSQNLEIILEAADKVKDKPYLKFVLLGNGPEKEKLEKIKHEKRLNNVIFIESVSKDNMPSILKSVNAAIIPLKKLELFKGAIPSKIFENLAMRIPVLLGVDGEARELFVDQGKCAFYFEPENAKSLTDAVLKISSDPALCFELGQKGRAYAQQNFNRDTIAERFHDQLIAITNEK
jgi:glycosyltransferase involved in cell wall biosynthesis